MKLKPIIFLVSLVAVGFVFWKSSTVSQDPKPDSPEPQAASSVAPVAPTPSTSSGYTQKSAQQYSNFEVDPFAITKTTTHHQWTDSDGMKLQDVERLAHNEIEKKRLLKENQWVKSRELVYRKVTSQDLVAKALKDGSEVTEMIIPGPAGQEFTMVVSEVDYESSELGEDGVPETGVIEGHLQGDPSSEVVIAFSGQTESGFVTSEDLHLNYDSREPGQFTLSSIDLDKMQEITLQSRYHSEHEHAHHGSGSPHSH